MKKSLVAALLLGMLSACASEPAFATPESCITVEKFQDGAQLQDWFTIHTEGTGVTVELFGLKGDQPPEEVVMVLFEDGCYKQFLSRKVPVALPLSAAVAAKMDIRVN